jgi:ubiquinone/menaquinone biosynthesis C-methylase UbiE
MSETRDLADTFYGTCAGIYDSVATARVVGPWRARCVAELDLSPGDTVVDMGCGTGGNLPFLREQVGPGGTVVGVDLVGAMLRQARQRVEQNGWKNVHVVQGDATRPPVGTVDGLVSTFVVGMFDDPASAVRSWLGTVRPGGRVALLNAARSNRLALRPANLAFRLFTRATAPGHRLRLRSPTRDLERRWDESVDALFEGTVDRVTDRLGLGFVVLASGRVPESP